MILMPPHLLKQYRLFCVNSGVKDNALADYLKWLRYFLDFCEKYQVAVEESERIRLFLNKLLQKGQSEKMRQQAKQAVSLYFSMVRGGGKSEQQATTAEHQNSHAEIT